MAAISYFKIYFEGTDEEIKAVRGQGFDETGNIFKYKLYAMKWISDNAIPGRVYTIKEVFIKAITD